MAKRWLKQRGSFSLFFLFFARLYVKLIAWNALHTVLRSPSSANRLIVELGTVGERGDESEDAICAILNATQHFEAPLQGNASIQLPESIRLPHHMCLSQCVVVHGCCM